MDLSKTSPSQWLGPHSTAADVQSVIDFLQLQGTFRFPSLPNGLFSAAVSDGGEHEQTGYANIWVRDNIHIAHAHWVIGDTAAAVRNVRAILDFYRQSRHRFLDIIEGRVSASDPMDRPHIRFRGDLAELSEKWSHAQNDALGYWLWLTSKLALAGDLVLQPADIDVLILLLKYWDTIQFWQDADSGHWEESRKVAASSIGVAVGGLRSFMEWLSRGPGRELVPHAADVEQLATRLLASGQSALQQILPHECRSSDPSQARRYDSALLFLLYPMELGEEVPGATIVSEICEHLLGPHGIRRYLGDSYWCADYKTLLAADQRTADFSDNLGSRDQLLKPGMEAQWCIFDPILSIIAWKRFRDRSQQLFHLQRSLSQLTTAESRFGAYRCPESYFCEAGTYVPNDITPLLWTQANLRLALHVLHDSLP